MEQKNGEKEWKENLGAVLHTFMLPTLADTDEDNKFLTELHGCLTEKLYWPMLHPYQMSNAIFWV